MNHLEKDIRNAVYSFCKNNQTNIDFTNQSSDGLLFSVSITNKDQPTHTNLINLLSSAIAAELNHPNKQKINSIQNSLQDYIYSNQAINPENMPLFVKDLMERMALWFNFELNDG